MCVCVCVCELRLDREMVRFVTGTSDPLLYILASYSRQQVCLVWFKKNNFMIYSYHNYYSCQ